MIDRLLSGLVLSTLTSAGAAAASGPTFSNPLHITNPYQPFTVGAVKVYNGQKDGKADVVVDIFLPDTRTFQVNGTPVVCHILQETEFLDGQLIEPGEKSELVASTLLPQY